MTFTIAIMKKSIKVMAVVLAAVCAVSTGVTVAAVSAEVNAKSAVSVKKAENAEIVLKGLTGIIRQTVLMQ